jgi:hypothetical protein
LSVDAVQLVAIDVCVTVPAAKFVGVDGRVVSVHALVELDTDARVADTFPDVSTASTANE